MQARGFIMWPAINQGFTQEQFRQYVETLRWESWRPSLVVWHNTWLPTLQQWKDTAIADAALGKKPGQTRIENLSHYYKHKLGWSGSPHLFIADALIWVMNPLTGRGVHSPSWNRVGWGFEMIGNYDKESAISGPGLRVRDNCIFATAVLFQTLGLEPSFNTIKLHKEDPRTSHKDCPGKSMAGQKETMINAVGELMDGGDHSADDPDADNDQPAEVERIGVVSTDNLNFRRGPGVSFEATGELQTGTEVIILRREKNGQTEWLNVRTPAGYNGWVAGRFVRERVRQWRG